MSNDIAPNSGKEEKGGTPTSELKSAMAIIEDSTEAIKKLGPVCRRKSGGQGSLRLVR